MSRIQPPGFLEGGEDHYTQQTFEKQCTPLDVDLWDGTALRVRGWLHGVIPRFTELAVNIIKSHADQKTPFFM
jgi:hypothetical protein